MQHVFALTSFQRPYHDMHAQMHSDQSQCENTDVMMMRPPPRSSCTCLCLHATDAPPWLPLHPPPAGSCLMQRCAQSLREHYGGGTTGERATGGSEPVTDPAHPINVRGQVGGVWGSWGVVASRGSSRGQALRPTHAVSLLIAAVLLPLALLGTAGCLLAAAWRLAQGHLVAGSTWQAKHHKQPHLGPRPIQQMMQHPSPPLFSLLCTGTARRTQRGVPRVPGMSHPLVPCRRSLCDAVLTLLQPVSTVSGNVEPWSASSLRDELRPCGCCKAYDVSRPV